ncbi:hypothetical protein EV401DRAFT_1891174 [Pisolithus croceorrhizus]|nr:hypothetical protein EV401DRAFT_1891174 [Pisolithus croceorrhizus]
MKLLSIAVVDNVRHSRTSTPETHAQIGSSTTYYTLRNGTKNTGSYGAGPTRCSIGMFIRRSTGSTRCVLKCDPSACYVGLFGLSPHLRAPGPYKVFVWLPEGEDANEHLAIHVVGGKVLPLGPFLRRGVPGHCLADSWVIRIAPECLARTHILPPKPTPGDFAYICLEGILHVLPQISSEWNGVLSWLRFSVWEVRALGWEYLQAAEVAEHQLLIIIHQ